MSINRVKFTGAKWTKKSLPRRDIKSISPSNEYYDYLHMYTKKLERVRDAFANAVTCYDTLIKDDATYAIDNHLAKYRFDFDTHIEKIKKDLAKALDEARETAEADAKLLGVNVTRQKLLKTERDKCKELCKNLELLENQKWVIAPSKLNLSDIKLNEVVSWAVRFNFTYENWVVNRNVNRQQAFNPMQSAKTMEKCLSQALTPLMLSLASGLVSCEVEDENGNLDVEEQYAEWHHARIMLLNNIGHEFQLMRSFNFVQMMFKNVVIWYNNPETGKPCKDTVPNYATTYGEYLNTLISEHEKEDVSSDIGGIFDRTSQCFVMRRGKSKRLDEIKELLKFAVTNQHCIHIIMDESQDATGSFSVWRRFAEELQGVSIIDAYSDEIDDREKDEQIAEEDKKEIEKFEQDKEFRELCASGYVFFLYFSATPFAHNGTVAKRTYGVIGLNHTGIHCCEGYYVKQIDGRYVVPESRIVRFCKRTGVSRDKVVASKLPDLLALEDLAIRLGYELGDEGICIASKFYSARAHRGGGDTFTNNLDYMHAKLGLPANITTHEEYKDFYAEFWAKVIVWCINQEQDVESYRRDFPGHGSMLAIRISGENERTMRELMPAIQRHLGLNADRVILRGYFDKQTIKKQKEHSESTGLDVREFCENELLAKLPRAGASVETKREAKSETKNKHLVVFLTAGGRCGDQFPHDFRFFIELPGSTSDFTVHSQSLFGRSNGYAKGTPTVILPRHHVRLIRRVIAEDGHMAEFITNKGAKKASNKSKTWWVRRYTPKKEDGDYDYMPLVHDDELGELVSQLEGEIHLEDSSERIYGVIKPEKIENRGKGRRLCLPATTIGKIIAHINSKVPNSCCDLDSVNQGFINSDQSVTRHAYKQPGEELPSILFAAAEHERYKIKDGARQRDSSGGASGSGASSPIFRIKVVHIDMRVADGWVRKITGIRLLKRGMYKVTDSFAANPVNDVHYPCPPVESPEWEDFQDRFERQSIHEGDPLKSAHPHTDKDHNIEEEV
jgi:hypothetical protein